MDSQPEWRFCGDVVDSEAKRQLAKDVGTLLQNGWKPTAASDGIVKHFAFSCVADALVSCTSVLSYHYASNGPGFLYTRRC